MRTVLHILTRPDDPLARAVINQQEKMAAVTLEVVDLTQAQPDYDALVGQIFTADSVEVW
jgi:hypothetical protein